MSLTPGSPLYKATVKYTERELGEALKRVQDYPVPPVIRRYDRLFKWFMREHDLADFEVTGIAYDQLAIIKEETK